MKVFEKEVKFKKELRGVFRKFIVQYHPCGFPSGKVLVYFTREKYSIEDSIASIMKDVKKNTNPITDADDKFSFIKYEGNVRLETFKETLV